jgi:hypothetical protein
MTKKPTHGGKRQNAGRKPGAVPTVSKSISMPETSWRAFDAQRKGIPRGKHLAAMLESQKNILPVPYTEESGKSDKFEKAVKMLLH